MNSNRRGFTLIELIIVIVIIGILASISAPMMRGMKTKAILTEAVTGMSRIREAARQYFVVYNKYPNYSGFITDDANFMNDLGMRSEDFIGTYFSAPVYRYETGVYPGTNFDIRCYLDYQSRNTAPRASETRKIGTVTDGSYVIMFSDGRIFASASIPNSGFPPEPVP